MASKDPVFTVIRLFDALYRKNTWRQDELAKDLEVKGETAKTWLEAVAAGETVPLERSEDHRWVYWSVPASFIPGGIVVPLSLAGELLSIVQLSPPSELQGRVLEYLTKALPRDFAAITPATQILAGGMKPLESKVLLAVQEALAKGKSLYVRYYSPSESAKGSTTRVISVHGLDLRSPRRLVAFCHRLGRLKWFRLDRFESARDDSHSHKYNCVAKEELYEFVGDSCGGFHGNGLRIHCAFTILDPTADWAENNLPDNAKGTRTKNGVEVVIDTKALDIVATWIFQLKGDVVIHTPELKARVREMAEAALRATA